MSSSKSKITSVACPKCEQDFKFERVPKMASVVCPHCGSKIRLTRKKNFSSAEQSRSDSSIIESEQPSAKRPRLPVPELPVPERRMPDTIDLEPPADDVSIISTGGERPEVSFDEFETGEDEPETSEPGSNSVTKESDVEENDFAASLLPPKFLVPDIDSDENAVVLPTAGGGFQVVDKTEVHVMHEGRAVKLVSLSPEELKRVRLIENLVALVIAAAMLAVAAWLVL